MSDPSKNVTDFEKAGASQRTGLVAEFWDFLKHNKKWWLLPIIMMMLLVSAVVILGSTAAAPFIYTLF